MDWVREHLKEEDNSTLVIDDLSRQMNQDTSEIYSVASHHYACNVILVVHNLFDQNPAFRNISLNAKYLTIFKNPRDKQQISTFARQFAGGKGQAKNVVDIYNEATKSPYSYLFVDLHQSTPEQYRLRSNILMESEAYIKVYVLR